MSAWRLLRHRQLVVDAVACGGVVAALLPGPAAGPGTARGGDAEQV